MSSGCCNKLIQIWWLKAAEIFFSPSSGVQKSEVSITGLKSRCWQAHAPSRGFREESAPCFFQLLVPAGISWLVSYHCKLQVQHLQISVLFSYCLLFCACVKSSSISYKEIVIVLKAFPIIQKIFNHICKYLFSLKGKIYGFQVLGPDLFGGLLFYLSYWVTLASDFDQCKFVSLSLK